MVAVMGYFPSVNLTWVEKAGIASILSMGELPVAGAFHRFPVRRRRKK